MAKNITIRKTNMSHRDFELLDPEIGMEYSHAIKAAQPIMKMPIMMLKLVGG